MACYIGENDTSIKIKIRAEDHQKATARLDELKEIAQKIESEPCEISSLVTELPREIVIDTNFNFCCTAEKMIFEMKVA